MVGHLEEFEARLAELQTAGVAWYPDDFLEQLQRPEVRRTIKDLEEQVHHSQDRQQAVSPPTIPEGLIEYPVEGLNRFFFYVPDEIVVAAEVRDLVAGRLRPYLRHPDSYDQAAPDEDRPVAGYQKLRIDPRDSSVPALAQEQYQRLVEEYGPDHNLVAPNHIYMAGPMHCGGPGNNPDNKTADGLDLVPLPEPCGDAGCGVVVAVLDSGILPPSELPSWVKNNVVFDEPNDIEADYFDVVDDAQFIRYPRVHGTFVTGILLQVAPGATVLVRQVLDQTGSASDEDLGKAGAGIA
jgi:subtilisin family serine protease